MAEYPGGGGGGGGAPSGPAGGVLAGAFPAPGFAVDMATQAELDAAIVPSRVCVVTGVEALPGEPSPGVLVKIACNTVVLDTAAWWNTTSKRYIPQLAGRYLVSAYFDGAVPGSSGSFWDLAPVKNRGLAGAVTWLNRIPSSSVWGPNITAHAQFVMNGTTDWIELWGGQGSGSSVAGAERLEILYVGPA